MKVANYLERIADVSIYPIIALSMFLLVFVLMCIWAFGATKGYIRTMENLPLGIEPEITTTTQPSNNEPSKF